MAEKTKQAEAPEVKEAPTHTEAPASWNCKYISAEGFDCMLTLRGESGGDLLPKTQAAIAWLQEHGAQPTRLPSGTIANGNGQPAAAPTLPDGSPDPAWCSIHGIAMTRREKDGQVWYSHKDGDGWCRGKDGK